MYAAARTTCPTDNVPLEATRAGDPLVGTHIGGRYLILRRLGSGGMGAVYEAVQSQTRRRVAVKVVHKARDTRRKDLARMQLEARAVQLIDHPNVVKFLDYGQEEETGAPYIVMEILNGRTLSQEIKAEGLPMDVERACRVVIQAARGVAAAHEKGLVHRDIKPGNVMLLASSEEHGAPRVKVLDFGLVAGPSRLANRLTITGVVLGTPHYMSPEQVEHPPRITAACDVYALGVLLYQLVVGHRPFQGDSFFAVINSHLTRPIPKPRNTDKGAAIPRAVRRVWTCALQKDPDKRYKDAGGMVEALEQATFGDKSQVTAPAPPEALHPGERHLITVLTVTFVDSEGVPTGVETDTHALNGALELLKRSRGMSAPGPSGVIRGIFGLPSASEQDALHAFETGARIREHAAATIGARYVEIGLHTRYVLAAPRGGNTAELRPLSDPYEVATAVGREGRGHPGVALSGTTYRTLRRHLLDPLPVVGNAAGETVHVAHGSDTRPAGMRKSRVLALPPVGREDAILEICGWVDDCMLNRKAALHVVTGQAGIGKSALAVAAGRSSAQKHPGLQVLEAHPEPGRKAPYNVFERFLADAVGFTSSARSKKVINWIMEAVSMHGDSEAREDAWHILRLIGLDELQGLVGAQIATTAPGSGAKTPPAALRSTQPPKASRQRAFAAFANLFRSIAAQGGVLMLVDDGHYADSGSLDLLDYLLRELADFPLCVLVFSRQSERLAERHDTKLGLGALDKEAATDLVHRLVGEDGLPAQTVKRIVSRAEGNPLFIEELVRVATEGPPELVGRLPQRLPDSIRAVISARIDALSSGERSVLKAAAIVGRDFWSGAVACQPGVVATDKQTDSMLASLMGSGFIMRRTVSRFESETEWSFANQLIQEAAYQLAEASRLSDGHMAVAQWLADGPAASLHALIAYHLERSGETDRAATAWRAAADAARDRYANNEAAADYEKALALQTGWPALDVAAVQLELGIALHQSGDRQRAERFLESAARSKELDGTGRVKALRYLARCAAWAGELEVQKKLLKRAVKKSAAASLSERLLVASDFAYALIRSGRMEMASKLLDDAIQTAYSAEQLGELLMPLAQLHQSLGLLYRNSGRLADAEREAKASMELFDQLEYPAGKATTLTSLSVCLRDLQRFREAADAAARSAEFFREWGYRVHELTALINLGWSRLEGGDYDPAWHLFRQLRAEFESVITSTEAVLIDAGAALSAAALGAREDGEALARQCLDTGRGAKLGEVRGWAFYAAGIVLKDTKLLEDSAACWATLDRPAWQARTLEALATLSEPPLDEVMAEEAATIRRSLAGGA